MYVEHSLVTYVTVSLAVSKAKGDVPNQSSSFENLMAPYLSGQWPKDGQWQRETPSPLIFSSSTSCFSGAFTSDKQTQVLIATVSYIY